MKEITKKGIINPITLLILMSIAMPVAFNVWSAMLNNFVVEKAKQESNVKKYLINNNVKRQIYVKNRLINFII